jgi:phytoene dehydrogenase-like protein
VLLTAYPEASEILDYSRLDLKSFSPGALSWFAGRMNPIVDPWRMPGMWREALRSEFGTLGDKLRMARLRSRLKHSSIAEIFKRPERSTKDALKSEGFSQEVIHRFFRPFLGGILLDGELKTTSRMFEFVFKMLSKGSTSVPARGMGAIPAQIAEKFSAASMRLNSRVESLHENEITLAGGESMRSRNCSGHRRAGGGASGRRGGTGVAKRQLFLLRRGRASHTATYAYAERRWRRPCEYFAVMTQVSPSYAPAGKQRISVPVLGTQELTVAQLSGFVIAQMKNWFGVVARSWRLLRRSPGPCLDQRRHA